MGRKTWDSIPPRFRPLKDRVNVVITRGVPPDVATSSDNHVRVGSLSSAIDYTSTTSLQKTFVIGGAQIYMEALDRPETKRILLTRILTDFECDTYFPLQLGEDGRGEGWARKTKEDLDLWVGETVPYGVQEENGTKYVFELWERT
jgi:dihydrofolate reductase